MLSALTALGRTILSPRKRAKEQPEQLALGLDTAPRDAVELLARLHAMGLAGIDRCRLTRNRTVMVSFRDGELRIHEGYLGAPREVHEGIVRFVSGRTRPERDAGRAALLGWKVPERPPRAPAVTHPDDLASAKTLAEWHERYNLEHFDGALRTVPIVVSRRMKSRLGHYVPGPPAEIAISRRHLRRHGWEEALHTLLHEMVHQWQHESGLPVDHGAKFRRKCREVGITPSARRVVEPLR